MCFGEHMLDKTEHVKAHPLTRYKTKPSFTWKERSTLCIMRLYLPSDKAQDELVS